MSQCEQNPDGGYSDKFMEIVTQHEGFIQMVIRSAMQNREDREDVYQEVLLCLSQLKNLDEIKNIKGFLCRLAVNKSNSFLKKKLCYKNKLKKRVQLLPPRTEEPAESVEHEVIVREEIEEMIRAIGRHLKRSEAQALLLGLRYPEDRVAQILGVKKTTIIHHASIGLKKMRSIFKQKERAQEKEGDTL